MPPDAAADRSIDVGVDTPPDLTPDVSPDLALSDAADAIPEAGLADGPEPDLDMSQPDTGIDLGPPAPDGGSDLGAYGPEDARVDAPPSADARADAPDGGAGDLMETPPDLRVRGGGCQCASAASRDSASWPLAAWLGAAGLLASRRGRRPRADARKKI